MNSDIDVSKKSDFRPVGRHYAVLPCPACGSMPDCVHTKASARTVDCGGPVERDAHYGQSFCKKCDVMVPSREVS